MRQHRESGHIARGEDVRHVRAHLVVHFDRAAVQFQTEVFEADARRNGATTDAHQDLVAFGRQRFAVFVYIDHFVAANFGHFAVEIELDPFLCVNILQHRTDFAVQSAEDFRQHLYDGHFGAEAVEKARELHPDYASADDYQQFGLFFQVEDFAVRNDHVAGFLDARNRRNESFRTGAQ